MKNELNFPPNFEGLVLGYIDADFRDHIFVGKRLTRSTCVHDEIYNSTFFP